jgi:hypothetical protein
MRRNGSTNGTAHRGAQVSPAAATLPAAGEAALPPLTLGVAAMLYEHVKDVPLREHELRCWVADLGRALHG